MWVQDNCLEGEHMKHPRVRSLDTMVRAEQARGRLRAVRLEYGGGMAYRPFSDLIARTTGFLYSPKSIERQEKGESRLDGEWVLAVAAATGADPGWLLAGTGQAPAFVEEPVAVRLEAGEEVDLLEWFRDAIATAPERQVA